MSKEDKTNVMRILEEHGISYVPHEYPHGADPVDGVTVARSMGQPLESVFKTLVARGSKGGIYVFVIPVEATLDFKKAARAVGDKSIEMVPVKEIQKLTGYVRGGCSPIGMKKNYPTFFAEEVVLTDSILVSAGKIGYQVELAPDDLIPFVRGGVADVTVHPDPHFIAQE